MRSRTHTDIWPFREITVTFGSLQGNRSGPLLRDPIRARAELPSRGWVNVSADKDNTPRRTFIRTMFFISSWGFRKTKTKIIPKGDLEQANLIKSFFRQLGRGADADSPKSKTKLRLRVFCHPTSHSTAG